MNKPDSSQKVAELILALQDQDVHVRWKAAGELGQLSDLKDVDPLINMLQNEHEWGPLCGAIYALGRLEDSRAVEFLIKTPKHKNYYVRQASVEALGYIGDERAIEPLLEAFNDENRIVSQEIPTALALIDEPAVLPVIDAFENGKLSPSWAALTLGQFDDERALQALLKMQQEFGDQTSENEKVSTVIANSIKSIKKRLGK